MFKYCFLVISFILVTFGCDKGTFISIGTGGQTGVYYPVGQNISKLVNAKESDYKVKATAESTAGSVYNINTVLSGGFHFGIAQSDIQYLAYEGLGDWKKKGKQKDLRSLFSLHSEALTLVASVDSKVENALDLKGKKVNIGLPGTGHRRNVQDLLTAVGLSVKDINEKSVKPISSSRLVQDERLDAFFYTVGHPNGSIKEATSGRIKVKLISLDDLVIKALTDKYSYYTKTSIPKSLYPNSANTGDINTIGVRATLVSSKKVSDNLAYIVTKEVFENFDKVKNFHPSYKLLKKEDLLQGLSAPIHKGALKYYKEAGLLSKIDKKLIIK